MRVRLKADGRLVEVLADGSERLIDRDDSEVASLKIGSPSIAPAKTDVVHVGTSSENDPAAFARRVRAATRLSQTVFAARLGVPVETVRNWEQGKRAPRGPARALLKIIDKAPDMAFAVLGGKATAAE